MQCISRGVALPHSHLPQAAPDDSIEIASIPGQTCSVRQLRKFASFQDCDIACDAPRAIGPDSALVSLESFQRGAFRARQKLAAGDAPDLQG